MTDIENILAERRKTHGDFAEHARVAQNLKAMAHNSINWTETTLTPSQMEAVDMILHKIGRILAGNPSFKDHWDDIAGYAKLVADRCPQC